MKINSIINDVTIRAHAEGVEAATKATEQLARASDSVVSSSDKVQRSTLDTSRAYERLQRDIDLTYRQQQNFERGQRTLDRALNTNKISVEAYDRSMSLLTAKYGPASVAADRFGASVKQSSANVGGIAAQFQDVAVQLAGGQSPFLIALQQGTQLSGQLEQTGGGVKSLGAALMSLVSPMSLATLGGIAGFGLLVQYLTSAGEKVETLDDRLQTHADVISKIKDAYAEAAEGLGKYAAESTRILDLQLRAATTKLKADLASLASELAGATTKVQAQTSMEFGLPADLAPVVAEATTKFKAFNGVLIELRNSAVAGTPNIAAFRDEVARIAAATTDTGVQRLAAELLAMSDNAFRAEQALGGSARAIGVLSAAASSGLVALNGFNAALRTLQMGVPEMAKALTAQKDLTEANDSYRKGLADAKVAESAGGMTERAAAAATETYSRRVRDLNDAFQQRVRTITGANDLEKEFGKTLQSTTINGLEGEAKGIAQARVAYEDRNRQIADSVKLGLSDAEATDLRAKNEKILAQELKNVAAANKSKASSGGSSGSGSDAFDNALQRSRDTIEELKQQQEQASKTTAEVYKLTEANKLRRAAASAGRSDEEGITAAIEAQAEAYAKQRKATEDAIEAQKRYQESVRETADSVASFVKDLVGGKGLDSALKSLGQSYLNNSLDALLTGKGPFASALGLAPTEKGGLGGIFNFDYQKLTKAVTDGTSQGTFSGFSSLFGSPQQGPTQSGATLDSVNRGSMASGIVGVGGAALGAYGAGASTGSAVAGALTGALSGAMAGASFGPAGMAIGAIIGAGAGIFGASSAKKKAKEERERVAQENYRNAQADIASFRSQARGEPQDTLATRIRDAETFARKLADVAFLAGKVAEATAIWADGQVYAQRAIGEFQDGFRGLIESLTDGMGPSGPFSTAKGNIKSLGDEMKAFIASTQRAYGDTAGQVQEARNASAAYALSVLDGAKSLSTVGTRLEEIRGTSAGLQKVLMDLGWSAEQAAEAINTGVVGAMARLKASFEGDLTGKINDARGAGYLNELTNLFTEVASLRSDAAALGTDQGLVTDYFSAAAQEIVNGANLTGDAFNQLLGRFPGLIGVVREAGVTIDEVARAIEAASRRLGYQDRIFNALNDNSTLAGQLAAFDRNAQRERAEEIRLGGDAINELEGALAAERLKIITDFANSAAEEQKRALEEAQNFFDTFSRNLRQFVDGLRSGSDSPLSPEARLAAAQGQYNAQLALAQGGDRDAINGLTTYASALLEAGEAFYASSAGYQQIFDQVTTQLLALPTQVSAEQFIVDAIENAANATISAIDTNGDGFISLQEATNANLGSIFRELDLNGDGQISALELIRGAARDTANEVDYQSTIIAQTQGIISASNNLLYSANLIAASQENLLNQIRSLNSTQYLTLEALRGQFGLNNVVGINGITLSNNMVEALNKIVFNTASTVIGQKAGAPYTYATGGWVSGPGTGTSDSIAARLSNGEFVVNARAANENRDLLEQINGGAGRFEALAMPVPQPVGLPAMSGGTGSASETRMLREELRAVRQELSDIKRAVVAGALHVREGVDAGTSVQREAVRETKFKKKAA